MDEVKLTSYALGELQGNEAKEIEELLATNPEARAFVQEMKSLGANLGGELQKEGFPKTGAKLKNRRSQENAIAIASSICIGLALFVLDGRQKILGFFERILGNTDYRTEQILADQSTERGHLIAGFHPKHVLLILGISLLIFFVVKKILALKNRD